MSEEPEQNQAPKDYEEPVAYDQQGRPLYAHPPQQSAQSQQVYVSRPIVPANPEIPQEVQDRVEASHRRYPHLNLSDGEFIITAIRRHPIGLLQIWSVVLIMILLFVGAFVIFFANPDSSVAATFGSSEQTTTLGAVMVGGLSVLCILGGMAATYIYNGNRFYLTNESVIQEIQTSLFAKHEQTVSLANVEDASYMQNNIIQLILNYGSIRLSTEGDETTYRFSYVTNPKKHIARLNTLSRHSKWVVRFGPIRTMTTS